MGLSEHSDEEQIDAEIIQKYEDLCLDLNLDKAAKEEAWQAYERISHNYSLDGDTMHWLACALYVACRRRMPTVGRGESEGNCVSLTRMLRSTKLSLLQFFNKMKKWADMANLPQDLRDKVDRLERNFAVSTVIFKKFEPIFLDIFKNPADDPPKAPRSRKQRRLPCTVSEVFNFCWTTFVLVKGYFPAISDDLVNSYHLLLCCIDWFYTNALLSNRRDLLNPNFQDLPKGFSSPNYKPPSEVPCLIAALCEQHEGLVLEAKGIKEHWWKPYIRRNFEKKLLRGKQENLTGILDIGTFESNSKSTNNAYETYVLSVGDFDERIFLGEDANADIGTPAKSALGAGDLQQHMQVKKIQTTDFPTHSLVTSTPLTGRRYLKEKEAPITPVSTATQSVCRLQALLAGRKTCPNEELVEMFKQCSQNPQEEIVSRVQQMGEAFCQHFSQPSEDNLGSHVEFARRRLQLGESLYYKTLENIMANEIRRFKARNKPADISNLLCHDTLHRSLFACCLEIVIFSYNSQRTFPWIVDIFEISPYHFYKVIELLIRAEDGLSRDVVKHLNHIEEQILESYAWRAESPLWDAIKENDNKIATCEEVSLPNMIEREGTSTSESEKRPPPSPASSSTGAQSIVGSPLMHPQIKRLAGEGRSLLPKKDLLQSPTGPSAADRFSSPTPGSAKRRLFSAAPASLEPATSESAVPSVPTSPRVVYQQAKTEDGRQVLISMQIISPTQSPRASSVAAAPVAAAKVVPKQAPPNKPKKTGSLSIFLRKVYHLASVRLRHLCEHLGVGTELRSQMWTAFEYALVNHIGLMQDRHLDQILMCSVYVMGKVTGQDRSFQDVMRCYRFQPQAKSHVYRSVLLTSRKRHSSGDSDSSRTGANETTDLPSLTRSTSTMPVQQSSSQPPTPTKLVGTQASFEFDDRGEDRGDLIRFYNSCFVKKVTKFAIKFAPKRGNETCVPAPPLSPLPLVRPHTTSPRRVSNRHELYISPHKGTARMANSKFLYCFNRSPAKDLEAINKMVRQGSQPRSFNAGKRLLQEDVAPESPTKRPCTTAPNPMLIRRVEELLMERQASNMQ